MKENHLSIWFIIGLQLAVFGVLICGVSIYDIYFPPSIPTVFAELHAGIYWGALMLALGLFYIVKFRKSGRKP